MVEEKIILNELGIEKLSFYDKKIDSILKFEYEEKTGFELTNCCDLCLEAKNSVRLSEIINVLNKGLRKF